MSSCGLLLAGTEVVALTAVVLLVAGVLGVTMGGGTIDFFLVPAGCGLAGWDAIEAHVNFLGGASDCGGGCCCWTTATDDC